MNNYAVVSNKELAEELRERLRLGGGGSVVLSATQVQEIIKRLPKTKPPGHLRREGR